MPKSFAHISEKGNFEVGRFRGSQIPKLDDLKSDESPLALQVRFEIVQFRDLRSPESSDFKIPLFVNEDYFAAAIESTWIVRVVVFNVPVTVTFFPASFSGDF